ALTFHMGGATSGFVRSPDTTRQHNLDYAQHAADLARKHGLSVGYEAGGLGDLRFVSDRVDGWGINLDIGHAHMAAGNDEGFFAYFDTFQDLIVEVHHNGVNHYWGRYMEHQPPHLNNTLDYQHTYERLRDDGYTGPIICEIQGQDIAQVIRHCQESKEMISGIWNGALSMKNRWYEAAQP
ncbi:MAG: sugar phosphate isomerase/epimerase, partial [Armatimonadetes bacterium]|nr:sugar phosphate isomerase/epimerase [Armatimonadota bacterium]